MYEKITSLIPKIRNSSYGKPIVDNKNNGSPEHPKHIPYISYEDIICELEYNVYEFHEQHPEFELDDYNEIIKKHQLGDCENPIAEADVSAMDGQLVMALLFGIFRSECFCDGVVYKYCKNGCVIKWLERLAEL